MAFIERTWDVIRRYILTETVTEDSADEYPIAKRQPVNRANKDGKHVFIDVFIRKANMAAKQ